TWAAGTDESQSSDSRASIRKQTVGHMSDHAEEIARRERYEFGKNWQRFLGRLNAERIDEAERSLRTMLGVDDLAGTSFLDIGSGSGLVCPGGRKVGAR